MSHRITLSRTGLKVSPICYGSWQLSPSFWGAQPEDTMIAAMRKAFDVGVNFFDTADAYGDGYAEQVMGKALADLRRDELVIATKVFWRIDVGENRFGDLSADHIMAACDASLKRLNMDYVDLYQCHSYDHLTDPNEIAQAMDKLVEQGKILAYGVSNWTVEQMRHGLMCGKFATCQPYYSLLRRNIERDLLPFCKANQIGTLVFSPLHRGLLTGKYKGNEKFDDLRKDSPDFQDDRFTTLCDQVTQVGEIAKRYSLTTTQLILIATLMHPAIDCAIVGIKNPDQITEAAGAMGKSVDHQDWHKVRAILSG